MTSAPVSGAGDGRAATSSFCVVKGPPERTSIYKAVFWVGRRVTHCRTGSVQMEEDGVPGFGSVITLQRGRIEAHLHPAFYYIDWFINFFFFLQNLELSRKPGN